jgi:hypothetical protein
MVGAALRMNVCVRVPSYMTEGLCLGRNSFMIPCGLAILSISPVYCDPRTYSIFTYSNISDSQDAIHRTLFRLLYCMLKLYCAYYVLICLHNY